MNKPPILSPALRASAACRVFVIGLAAWLAVTAAAQAQTLSQAPAQPQTAVPPSPQAQAAVAPLLTEQIQQFVDSASRSAMSAGRVEVTVGQLDPRLKLAACERVEPYLPNGTRLWGKAHIGLRCVQGPTPWNVYLPITVKVYGRALVATANLAAGSALGAADMAEGEVDLPGEPGMVFAPERAQALVGRTLLRPLTAGQGLRSSQLKIRQWFAAGDIVRITAVGAGFSAQGSGEALNAGVEGQTARIRTEGGRIVTATPVGDREVELVL